MPPINEKAGMGRSGNGLAVIRFQTCPRTRENPGP